LQIPRMRSALVSGLTPNTTRDVAYRQFGGSRARCCWRSHTTTTSRTPLLRRRRYASPPAFWSFTTSCAGASPSAWTSIAYRLRKGTEALRTKSACLTYRLGNTCAKMPGARGVRWGGSPSARLGGLGGGWVWLASRVPPHARSACTSN
jgi:hypothetical protein